MTCCSITCAGYAVVALCLFKAGNIVFNVVYPYFIAKKIGNLIAYSGGKWAVITGSTDGIGKGYAFELARKGMNVCLIARSEQKLADTKAEIEAKYSTVKVKTILFDFSTADIEDYQQMYRSSKLDALDVGVLINNVGRSLPHPEYQLNIENGLQVSRDVLVINTLSVVAMTQLILPSMRDRRKGVVVNVSSGSDMQPTPLLAIYAATKSFVKYTTLALRLEYAPSGVFIQCCSPFFVATKLARIRKATISAPSGETFARSAVGTIGLMNETNGYWAHQLQAEVNALIPMFLRNKINLALLGGVRQAALKKKSKTS